MKQKKIRAALIGNAGRIGQVYGAGRRERLGEEFDLYPDILTVAVLREKQSELKDIRYLFSTWGMPALNSEQIVLMPSLEALFYGAGTVQAFARPFLDAGVKVFSAWGANAVPVAEYTLAQILLANKGFFRAAHSMRSRAGWKSFDKSGYPGNMEVTVALLGAGMIGRGVIERLKNFNLKVIVFDPFLSDEAARKLGVGKVELTEAFRRGFVVSNHLANLPETVGMLKGEHFAAMQPYATFINTGRGATVDEPAMIEVLKKRPDLTAVLDVTFPEPPEENSPLYSMDNVVLTPHIAGAIGQETWRLADYMIEEAIALRDGRGLRYEVRLEMLDRMA